MEKKVSVINRSEGMVGYKLDNMKINRLWEKPGSILYVTEEELKELMIIPGGSYLLENSLIIDDKEVRERILGKKTEPEYDYTEKEIREILYESDNEVLYDCLDYAPEGVLELIRKFAIEKLPNTMEKVEAINKKMGINLMVLSQNKMNDTDKIIIETTHKRRTQPLTRNKDEKKHYEVVDPIKE